MEHCSLNDKVIVITGSTWARNSQPGMGFISGKNLALKRGRRIAQEWVTTGWPKNASPSRLTINLRPIKQGTEISLLQEDVPAKDAATYDQGWHDYYWQPMARFFQK